jgi:hypothetical protein
MSEPTHPVIAIISAHNEGDVIAQVIGDLIAQGVAVHLIDHGSTDDTVAQVQPLVGRGLLAIETLAHDGRFTWRAILEHKQALAARLPGRWFIHADADELREAPWPGVSLVDALQAVEHAGYNAVDFALFNFRPLVGAPPFEPGQDLRHAFTHYQPGAAFDTPQIKCWLQPPGGVDLASSGGHQARFEGRRVFPLRFLLRHYPIRGQAQGERKVWQERVGRFLDDERADGWHVQYDRFERGASFLVDPAQLTAFDPLAARLELSLSHRGVEDLQSERVRLERELERTRAELERTRAELEQRDRALAAEQAAHSRAARALSEAQQAHARALEQAGRAVDDAEARLDALLGSRTWRWAAPARLAWRALGRR